MVSLVNACKVAAEMLNTAPEMPIQPAKRGKVKDYSGLIHKLWSRSAPLGKLAQSYLRGRGITNLDNITDLRFMAACQLRDGERVMSLPALLAAVRDHQGQLMALHRNYLDPTTGSKANILNPKRSLGQMSGGGCWLSQSGRCLVVAEGIETALSLKAVWPRIALAALSAAHLGRLNVPPHYQRIVIAADNDVAGLRAAALLVGRLGDRQVRIIPSRAADFNDDLCQYGRDGVRDYMRDWMKV